MRPSKLFTNGFELSVAIIEFPGTNAKYVATFPVVEPSTTIGILKDVVVWVKYRSPGNPVGPVAPVAPVEPVAPVGPVAPVKPSIASKFTLYTVVLVKLPFTLRILSILMIPVTSLYEVTRPSKLLINGFKLSVAIIELPGTYAIYVAIVPLVVPFSVIGNVKELVV